MAPPDDIFTSDFVDAPVTDDEIAIRDFRQIMSELTKQEKEDYFHA